jgi:hypothetical protein
LFELRPGASGGIPDITRVAVSEHILLGGDNIDLALAVLLEPRLVGERGHGARVGDWSRIQPYVVHRIRPNSSTN